MPQSSSTLSAEAVRVSLREHILANYLFTSDPSQLDDDSSFRDTQLIDSMGMMQLVQFLESEFQIKTTEDHMVPENLDSVNRLVQFILRERERRSNAA